MEKRITKWRRISLLLILFALTESLFFLIAGFFSNSAPGKFALTILLFLNPSVPILTLISLLSEGALDQLCLLIPILESLLLLSGWWLAAKGKRSGSMITVALVITHFLFHVFLSLVFLPAFALSLPYIVFPVLLLRGYFQWQPALRNHDP